MDPRFPLSDAHSVPTSPNTSSVDMGSQLGSTKSWPTTGFGLAAQPTINENVSQMVDMKRKGVACENRMGE